mgnify:CR=1 FL=1
MAQEVINIGTTPNDGTGDTIRGAGLKINNNFTELYATEMGQSQIEFVQNEIYTTESNADLVLSGSGTGIVRMPNMTVDSTINMSDNQIKINTTNANLVLATNGTGKIQINSVVVLEGTSDNTVIGDSTPAAGTFTPLSFTTLSQTGVTLTDNEILAKRSNDDLELKGNGTGTVAINGIKWPSSDGTANQVFKTDGSGNISYFTSPVLFDVSDITDGTATVLGNSSSAQVIDTFAVATYRSAKYLIQVSDSTANRFALLEANVTHNGTNAFISITKGADNGTNDGSTVYETIEISADVNSGNVRLLGQVNNTNNQVVKFVRRPIKV